MSKKSKILITGILGLFGSHTSRYLLDKSYDIIGVDDGSGGYEDYLDSRIKFYKINLLDHKSLNKIFLTENIDIVIHYAAYAAECLSDYIKQYNYNNNVITSINIINNCINHNVQKLLFTSSMSVYGHGIPPFKETDILGADDSYALGKMIIERELKISHHKFGLNYSIIRPHNVVSSQYQNYADKYRNVLAIWGNSIVNNGGINVYGNGLQKRSFSDIKYMLPIVEKLLTSHDGEIFNIGSDQPITILEAAQMMKKNAQKLGFNPPIKHLEPRTEVKYAYSSHEKAQKLLNFKDETNLDQVMYDLLVWVKNQPKRDVRYMDYEITKNLYSYWRKK